MKTDLDIAKKMVAMSQSAGLRGIEYALSFSKLKKLMNTKTCYFTGDELVYDKNDDNHLTIDRLDNDVGYTDSNVVACSKVFNLRKGNLTVAEIKLLHKGLKKRKLL